MFYWFLWLIKQACISLRCLRSSFNMSLTPFGLMACFCRFPYQPWLVSGDDNRQVDRLHHSAGSWLYRHCRRRFVFDLLVTHRLRFWVSACYGSNFLLVRRRRAHAGCFHYLRFSPPALSLAVRDETVAVTRFLSTGPLSLRVRDWDFFWFYYRSTSFHLPGGFETVRAEEVIFQVCCSSYDRQRNHACHNSTFSPQAVVEEIHVMWRQASNTAFHIAFSSSHGCQCDVRAVVMGEFLGTSLCPRWSVPPPAWNSLSDDEVS